MKYITLMRLQILISSYAKCVSRIRVIVIPSSDTRQTNAQDIFTPDIMYTQTPSLIAHKTSKKRAEVQENIELH